MGWNSWDAYGLTINEQQFRENTTVLKEKLASSGWRYAVVDEGWYFENPEDRPRPDMLRYVIDSNGRYIPTRLRFPSAGKSENTLVLVPKNSDHPLSQTAINATIQKSEADPGFKPLADWVHSQGLLFGIHIVRGIPRISVEWNLSVADSNYRAADAADTTDACPWDPTNWGVKDNAAGQAWYDSLLKQYAGWGVDLLKVDCISDHPYKADEIRMIRRAIDKTGRPMVLSLSPGPTAVEHADEVAKLSTMWRISNDVWDVWANPKPTDFPQDIRGQFDRAAQWVPFDLDSGHWPDLDMLPLGELRPSPGWGKPRTTRLTSDEQKTLLTLWAIKQSPLILGANLTLLDDATLKLLTNRDWIALDQLPGMMRGRVQPDHGGLNAPLPERYKNLSLWSARKSRAYAALFNLGDTPLSVDLPLSQLNLGQEKSRGHSVELYDVWAQRSFGTVSRVKATIPPHGCLLLERR